MIDRSRWTVQYMQRVLATDPIGYWMQDEKQGAVSYDMVTARSNGARNGTYTGVTLGQPGIGDGRTSPLFDGATDYMNGFSASLAASINMSEISIMLWLKMFNVGVWTDGARRDAFGIFINGANYIYLSNILNNRLEWKYTAGGIQSVVQVIVAETDWMALFMTASLSAGGTGEMMAYRFVNGIGGQVGATQVGLGVWAGALPANNPVIGAFSIVPANPTYGYIAHGAIWDRPIMPATAAGLAVVE